MTTTLLDLSLDVIQLIAHLLDVTEAGRLARVNKSGVNSMAERVPIRSEFSAPRPIRTIIAALERSAARSTLNFNGAVLHRADDEKKFIWCLCDVLLDSKTRVKVLKVARNGLGEASGKALGKALATNTSLTSLDISNNNLCGEELKPLCEALEHNTTLKMLDLNAASSVYGCEMGPQGAAYIAKMLGSNASLTSLNLAGKAGPRLERDHERKRSPTNNTAFAKALAPGIAASTTLTSLDLSWNMVGPEGGVALAGALRANASSLTLLNLVYNQLGPEGGVAIADALRASTASLTSINVGGNQIGQAAALDLIAIFKEHDRMTSVGLALPKNISTPLSFQKIFLHHSPSKNISTSHPLSSKIISASLNNSFSLSLSLSLRKIPPNVATYPPKVATHPPKVATLHRKMSTSLATCHFIASRSEVSHLLFADISTFSNFFFNVSLAIFLGRTFRRRQCVPSVQMQSTCTLKRTLP